MKAVAEPVLRLLAVPTPIPRGRPLAASASIQNDRAPMRFSSLTKKPGPPPTSITIRPAG
jgi:hypothetical protein